MRHLCHCITSKNYDIHSLLPLIKRNYAKQPYLFKDKAEIVVMIHFYDAQLLNMPDTDIADYESTNAS